MQLHYEVNPLVGDCSFLLQFHYSTFNRQIQSHFNLLYSLQPENDVGLYAAGEIIRYDTCSLLKFFTHNFLFSSDTHSAAPRISF